MEQMTSAAVQGTFNKVVADLKNFNAKIYGRYLAILCIILLFLSALTFNSAWWDSILMLVAAVLTLILELPFFFKCCEWFKKYEDKIKLLDNLLIKGCIYTVLSIIMFLGASGFAYVSIALYLISGILDIIAYIIEWRQSKSDATQSMV